MTVARDDVQEFAAFTTTSPATLSYTPIGTARGIVVGIVQNAAATDTITGVTYGGVAMERVQFADDVAGEPGAVHLYFLGSGIPTGTQTVSIAHTGSAQTKWAIVQSLTAAGDTEVGNVGVLHDFEAFANPTLTLNSGSVSALRMGVIFSGANAPTDLTPLSGMEANSVGTSHDFGTQTAKWACQTTASTGAFALGYTAAADDTAFIAVSVQEIQTDGFPKATGPVLSWFETLATAHLVHMPPVVDSGDLLIVGFSIIGSVADTSTPTGWTLLDLAEVGTLEGRLFYRIADGTEGGTTVDFVTTVNMRGAAYALRVTDWHGTTPPEVGTFVTGTSTTPNPPSLTPSWGAADNLWLVAVTNAAFTSASSYSTSYDNGTYAYNVASGVTIHTARRKLNATTEDPGVVTLFGSQLWVAQTIAIRPSAGGSQALDGIGTAATAGNGLLTLALTLAASGNTAAAGNALLEVARTLAGQGDTAAAGSGLLAVSKTLTGSGNTASAGTAELSIVGQQQLDGTGNTASAGSANLDVLLTLTGQGDTAAAGSATPSLTVGLTGSGDTATAGSGTLIATIQLDGQGDTASAGTGAMVLSRALTGSGNTASSGAGTLDLGGEVSIIGSGTVSAAGSGNLTVAYTLEGSGNVASAGTADLVGAFVLTGTGNVASSGSAELSGTSPRGRRHEGRVAAQSQAGRMRRGNRQEGHIT